jgi:hypothetical protein
MIMSHNVENVQLSPPHAVDVLSKHCPPPQRTVVVEAIDEVVVMSVVKVVTPRTNVVVMLAI